MQTEPLETVAADGLLPLPRLSVVIVNYNVRYFLEQALLSVRRAAQGLDVEVFVVDNASSDRSVDMVRAKFPEVRLIVNDRNRGFAVANNQAIRESSGDYVLLLNPDTVLEEDCFRSTLAYLEAHPEAGALGVKMIDGSGTFLPESKRGFPGPWVAFCKTVGLSRLFRRSRLFNGYHLGYLDDDSIHDVDVLAGAFMLLRRRALDQCGLLDERFFMYGEDIDLSYRLQQAGYRNVYYPRVRIIHYKGESTRKGSLNYVRAFYQAMILFARKHFSGGKASLFVWMLQGAIYLRAGWTLLVAGVRRLALPLLDVAVIYGGLIVLKDFWATYHFRDPDYYSETFLYVNAPLYTLIWVASLFFSGAYDQPERLRRLLRGLLFGTLLLAAIYGFLDQAYRSSRALIVLGALWAGLATVALRYLGHFVRYGDLALGRADRGRIVLVGGREESQRVERLLRQAGVPRPIVGTVAPFENPDREQYLGGLDQLDDVVRIYQPDDIVFCSRDVANQAITHWMTRLGPDYHYRIVPEDGLSIIGSSSRNTSGELYTIEVQFNIDQSLQRRNKRMLDLSLGLFLLATLPLHGLWGRSPGRLFRNATAVVRGAASWVGYGSPADAREDLPPLRPGILRPVDGLALGRLDPSTRRRLDPSTRRRLDLLYAKDYTLWRDLEIIWRGRRYLDRSIL